MNWINRLLLVLTALYSVHALASDEDLLEPDVAFAITATAINADTLRLTWNIADGYYLYKTKFKFYSQTEGVEIGPAELPAGKIKDDEFFGKLETYRKKVDIIIPIDRGDFDGNEIVVRARSQGCADIGVCYPPHDQTTTIQLPAKSVEVTAIPSVPSIASLGSTLGINSNTDDELLAPDDAFQFDASIDKDGSIKMDWVIAEAHYMYRDKIKLSIIEPDTVTLSDIEIPPGEEKEDEYFGKIAVFHQTLTAHANIASRPGGETPITVKASFQGCAERGVCYPPIHKTVQLVLPPVDQLSARAPNPATTKAVTKPDNNEVMVSEQDRVTQILASGNLATILPFMFLAGLGLAFTACVYPMIPILSSLLVGQGEKTTRGKSFLLSLVYVEAVALTYAAIGVASGAFGAGIQSLFQNPWVLAGFALVFVALALSMFGFFNLQIPAALQSKLTEMSGKQKGGNLIGVAIMGVLSALIIGPCAGPVLIGVLAFIGQQGDYVLGGLSLFVLGNGLGAPLLLIGATGGQVLPKAGGWMDTVKAFFGVVLLGVAIMLLGRILPGPITMGLWALLLIVPAVYMGAFEPLKIEASGWARLWKGLGISMTIYGTILIVGAATGGHDIFRPLANMGASHALSTQTANSAHTNFKRIKNLADFEDEVDSANGKITMLDFYADWCTYCIKFEDYTFSTPQVQAEFKNLKLIQADVTDADEEDRALMNHFEGVYAPPAILFFDHNGKEIRSHRVTGYMDADEFAAHIQSLTK